MDRIVVVGVGALGSHVVQLLRNLEMEIFVIDFDRVEQKNVLAQFHSKASVGKSKVVALQQAMQFLWGVKIQGSTAKLTAQNDKELLAGAKLVIDCLDNAEARGVVQSYVRKHKLNCLHGALAADGAFGRVVWDESFTIDSEAGQGKATCEGGEHLPFISIVASYIAKAAQDFVTKNVRRGYEIAPGRAMRI